MATPFEKFLKSVVEFSLAVQATETARKSDKYIKSQVYIYTSQVEAAGHYRAAANIQAARNAVFAGCVALCTMYVGGLIMGAVFRGAAAGTAAAEGAAGTAVAAEGAVAAESNALFQLIRSSVQASGLQASSAALPALETTVLEVCVGIPVRGLIAAMGTMITDWHNGKEHWTDIPKIGVLSAGGALRTGPALGFLLGALASSDAKQQREEFEKQVKTAAAKKLIETSLNEYSGTLSKELKNHGKYAQLVLVPPLELDSRIRQPMQREVDRVTDQFVKEQTGFFGGPERGDVYASVYGSLGASVWAPIAGETTRAYIHLQQTRQQKTRDMDNAFRDWVRSL